MNAYMPVQPDGAWWVSGCDDNPQSTMFNIQAREGCIDWAECEKIGWKVIAVTIRAD